MGIGDDIRPKNKKTSSHDDLFNVHTDVNPIKHDFNTDDIENGNHFFMKDPDAPTEPAEKEAPKDQTANEIKVVDKPKNTVPETAKEKLEDQFFSNSPREFNKKSQITSNNPQKVEKIVHRSFFKSFLWFMIFIALIGFAAYQGSLRYLNKATTTKTSENSNQDDKDVYAGEVITQDYTTQDETAAQESTSTSTSNSTPTTESTSTTPETTTATPTSTTSTPDKSSFTVQVLNGNGISNSAQKIKTSLINLGFSVQSVTNARNFNYTKTYIYHKTTKSAEAELVRNALSDRQLIVEVSDSVAKTYDVVVVVGKE